MPKHNPPHPVINMSGEKNWEQIFDVDFKNSDTWMITILGLNCNYIQNGHQYNKQYKQYFN